MTAGELVSYWRTSLVKDVRAPFLWSNQEALTYANAAYEMFVRLSGGVKDFTSEACEVSVVAGEAVAELHASVLTIHGATLASTNRPLELLNYNNVCISSSDDYGKKTNWMTTSEGRVEAMVIGMERGKVRWIKVPEADDTVNLHISRLPLAKIDSKDSTLDDVEDIHHVYLAYWMASLAYLKPDSDTYDPSASQKHGQMFTEYCAQVRREKSRYEHKPRTVAYGGL